MPKFFRLSQIAIIIIILMMAIGPAAGSTFARTIVPARSAPPEQMNVNHLQPELAQMAAHQPEQRVSVIVQKVGIGSTAEEMAARLGGTVTSDLHIINAFVAEMSAGAAQQLATSPTVRWVSLDAPMVETGKPAPTPTPPPSSTYSVTASKLKTAYNQTIGADKLWAEGYQGSGITVAVVDSGMSMTNPDLYAVSHRVLAQPYFGGGTFIATNPDGYGHGTHVAGIIGGDGYASGGQYIGVAPKVNLISVKVSDNQGVATASTVIAGLQWVNDNSAAYNIRVVNLSLNSIAQQSYNTDPLDAAVEILWFNKIVVVVSSGNLGKNAMFSPANDPFVITVGATDDRGTTGLSDDQMATYSGSGTTVDNFAKPDLVAPGTNIVSLLSNSNNMLATAHPANIVATTYFRMSGTSMAAPVVSGAVALLLQANPNLTPDQVKYRLMSTANKSCNCSNTKAGAGLLDAYAALHGITTQSANTGIQASQLLWSGSAPITWGSVNWNSVNWNSVNWNSVNWNSVNWNSVNWNSDYWGQ